MPLSQVPSWSVQTAQQQGSTPGRGQVKSALPGQWQRPWNENKATGAEVFGREKCKDLVMSWDRRGASLVAQTVKILPEIQNTWDWSLGQEDPWRRKRLPTPVFLPGEFHGQRAWWAIVQGIAKSRTWLSSHWSLHWDRRRGHGWLPYVGLDWVGRGPGNHG